jgi:hypothetical protein
LDDNARVGLRGHENNEGCAAPYLGYQFPAEVPLPVLLQPAGEVAKISDGGKRHTVSSNVDRISSIELDFQARPRTHQGGHTKLGARASHFGRHAVACQYEVGTSRRVTWKFDMKISEIPQLLELALHSQPVVADRHRISGLPDGETSGLDCPGPHVGGFD